MSEEPKGKIRFQEFALMMTDRLARIEEGIKNLGTKADIEACRERISDVEGDVDEIKKELTWYRRGLIGGLIVVVGYLLKGIIRVS